MDMDTFFVSVERLQNDNLHGKPVIIGSTSDRGVVSGCSYEARKYGIHSAMPMKMARYLCKDVIVIRGDMELYAKYSHMVTDIISESAPVYEKSSIDEHYIDITGMDRFFGCQKWMHELRCRIIKETGLPVSCGLSVNKTVSKIATGEAKPNGEKKVETQFVKPFLSPLSIRKIPMIGPQTYHMLRSMGIATIGILSKIPPEMLEKVMGKNGREIWKKANGIDPAPVIRYSEKKSLGTEHTFERDTTDIVVIKNMLAGMTEKLAYEMRRKKMNTSCVTVKIRYSNFDTHTLQRRIPYTSFDHELIPVVKELFDRLYQRRMLIRLIGVRFSQLIQGVQQFNIFGEGHEIMKLYGAIDNMRSRFGEEAIRRAETYQREWKQI